MTYHRPVYLDHHATTPVDTRVADVVLRAMTHDFGNANSIDHAFGRRARAIVKVAAGLVGGLVGASADRVRFTSGSTEALRLSIADLLHRRRPARLRVALTRVEHKALIDEVLAATTDGQAEALWIDVDDRARLDMDCLDRVLASGVDVLCVMAANNEVGNVYPIAECARRARSAGAAILVDATQAAGRIPVDLGLDGIDYLSMSAHKMYGPKGVGALVVGDEGFALDAVWNSGTPNVPGIAGFGEASRLRHAEMHVDERRVAILRDHLQALLCDRVPGLTVNGDRTNRLSSNLHVSIAGVPNDAIVARLQGTVALSTGAACVSGTHAPSHVLRAMGLSDAAQEGALRMGLGRSTTRDDVEFAAESIAAAVADVRTSLSMVSVR